MINATSARLSRMLEDEDSQIPESIVAQLGDETAAGVRERRVYRHVAVANGLKAGERIPYQVGCVEDNGRRFRSETCTLQQLPG
ncbi:MAG: metallophosphoesterase, partial [Verrucomicrobiaceae bacterium]|nr:metallophosphoesterase [Verrucomicrobiaceae bacterium]